MLAGNSVNVILLLNTTLETSLQELLTKSERQTKLHI